MEILVTYDVATVDDGGPRRLRRVAQVCTNYGQRVQQSVFECSVSKAQYEQMVDELLQEIDNDKDSIRLYRLSMSAAEAVETYGVDESIDFNDPLIL